VAEIRRALVRSEDGMDGQNKKHGRMSGGHKHGGEGMKRTGKRHKKTKRSGSGKVGGLTRLERERRTLAEAAPRAQLPVSPPAPSPAAAVEPPPMSFAGGIASPSMPAVLVETPMSWSSTIPANEVRPGAPGETEAPSKAPKIGWAKRRETFAFIACVAVAICGVGLLRACAPKGTPTRDDAAATGSCSDDASVCVARA
jgi:hypothetical protein